MSEKLDIDTLDAFTRAYIECALWSSNDESTPQGGVPMDANYDIYDIAPEAMQKMVADCVTFQVENAEFLRQAYELYKPHVDAPEKASSGGHDFWLTRNHHGAGFWDRGLGEIGEVLTCAAQAFREADLYVGDDGKIYHFPHN